jgi:hypothetical protein
VLKKGAIAPADQKHPNREQDDLSEHHACDDDKSNFQ